MAKRAATSVVIAALALVAACSPMIYRHDVPNLARVDAAIYRSGQIASPSGWAFIAQLATGRRVHVIKLNFDSEGVDHLPTGMISEYDPIEPAGDQGALRDVADIFATPDQANVDRALATLERCRRDPAREFCLVHCTHGQDRTGYVVATFRHVIEGWPKGRALDEAIALGFHVELVGLYAAWLRAR